MAHVLELMGEINKLREQLSQANAQAAAVDVQLQTLNEDAVAHHEWELAAKIAEMRRYKNTAGHSLLDELAALRERCELFEWSCEMGLYIQENAIVRSDTAEHWWSCIDVDDLVVGEGPTPEAAIAAARKAMETKT